MIATERSLNSTLARIGGVSVASVGLARFRAHLLQAVVLSSFAFAGHVGAQTVAASASAGSSTANALEHRLKELGRPGGLVAEVVARKAVEASVEVEESRARVAQARAVLRGVEAQFLPEMSLEARYMRFSRVEPTPLAGLLVADTREPHVIQPGERLSATDIAFEAPLDQYAFRAGIAVPITDYLLRIPPAMEGSRSNVAASELEVAARELSIDSEARLAYYEWIRAQAAVLVAEQALQAATTHLAEAESDLSVGVVSIADTLKAASEVKNRRLLLVRANDAVELATTRLRVLMHDAPRRTYVIGENVFVSDEVKLPLSVEEGYKSAMARRPEIALLNQTEAGLSAEAESVRSQAWPTAQVILNADYSNPSQRLIPPEDRFVAGWSAGVAVSWTPNRLASSNAQLGVLDAKSREVRARREGLLERLRMEVTQSMLRARESALAVDASRHAVLSAEEEYRVQRELFKAGRTTISDLSEAETELTQARFDLVDAYVETRMARVALRHALGGD